jgi:hypothetical protein
MFLQWCIYRRQARIMAHQAGEMTRQRVTMRRQLEAMGDQVAEMQSAGKQTERIIARMKDSAVMELRAYVCISKAVIRFTQERAPEIHVYMENFGKTPAYNVKAWIHTWIAQHPLNETLPPLPPGFEMGADILFSPSGKNRRFRSTSYHSLARHVSRFMSMEVSPIGMLSASSGIPTTA